MTVRNDGLDLVEFLMNVEDLFEIKLRDEEAQRAATVGDLHSIVVDKIASDRTAVSEREVWETLKAIVVEKLGVESGKVTRDAAFTNWVTD